MQGRILGASATANQGVILGDDGVRYSFNPNDWRNNAVMASTGMRVEFRQQGVFAKEVYTVGDSIVPPPPQPVHVAPPTPVTPRAFASPWPATQATRPFDPVPTPRPARPRPPQPKSRRSLATPDARTEALELRRNGALLLFLGPIGAFIFYFKVGTQMTMGTVVLLAVILVTIPFQYIFAYPAYIIIAAVILAMGDRKIDEYAHYIHLLREHGLFPSRRCKEECFHDTRRIGSPPA